MFGHRKFKAQGVYLGRQYQVLEDGRVDVDFGHRIQRFSNADAMVDSLDEIEASRDMGPLPDEQPIASPKKTKNGCGCLLAICVIVVAIAAYSNANNQTKNTGNQSAYTSPSTQQNAGQPVYSSPSSSISSVADVINLQFGRICHATIEGFFSSTLRLDWTAETNKLNAITVLAAVGKAKAVMYEKGIRYFKFPNNAGSYNVIDWKTGEKSLDNDRARYYFP